MHLPDTKCGTPSWFRRLGRRKVSETGGNFQQLVHHAALEIRGLSTVGPEWVERELMDYAPRIRPSIKCRTAVEAQLSKFHGEMVVGVHIRQGDFRVSDFDRYEAVSGRHTRVPIWWYHYMMQLISGVFPNVIFLLFYSGSRDSLRPLEESFRCVVPTFNSEMTPTRMGHQADSDAVADLFSLASCSIILGTPASSFSHWAGSNLGPPTLVVSPPLVTYPEEPRFVISSFRYKALCRWVKFSWFDQPSALSSWSDEWPIPRFDIDWW